jgi:hypothetical protein
MSYSNLGIPSQPCASVMWLKCGLTSKLLFFGVVLEHLRILLESSLNILQHISSNNHRPTPFTSPQLLLEYLFFNAALFPAVTMDGDPAVEPELDSFSLTLPLPYRVALIVVLGISLLLYFLSTHVNRK